MQRLLVVSCLAGCSLYFDTSDSHDAHPGFTPDAVVSPGDGGFPFGDASPDNVAMCTNSFSSTRWLVFDSDRDNFNRDLYMMQPDGSQLQRLTASTSIDQDPAPSPDGRKLAFASNRTGTFQIHLLDLTTNTVTQVTADAAGAQEPSFSHDGTRIAYRSGSSAYTIYPDGTHETFVADSGLGTFNAYFSPQFSADDTELYFDRNNEIDAVHLDGTGLRYIVNNWTTMIKAPTVSPSGLAVAYHVQCSDYYTSIWATPSGTGTNPCAGRLITPPEPMSAQHPAWGPDDVIAYERINSSNASAIALIATAPNSTPCRVSADPYDNRNPAWLIRP